MIFHATTSLPPSPQQQQLKCRTLEVTSASEKVWSEWWVGGQSSNFMIDSTPRTKEKECALQKTLSYSNNLPETATVDSLIVEGELLLRNVLFRIKIIVRLYRQHN